MLKQQITTSITNGAAALPTFKVWMKLMGLQWLCKTLAVLFNNLIIVHRGESINTAIAAVRWW